MNLQCFASSVTVPTERLSLNTIIIIIAIAIIAIIIAIAIAIAMLFFRSWKHCLLYVFYLMPAQIQNDDCMLERKKESSTVKTYSTNFILDLDNFIKSYLLQKSFTYLGKKKTFIIATTHLRR